MARRGVLLLASLVSLIIGCGGSGGSDAEVESADLVEVLLSEEDASTLEMFGPRPMTITDGTDSWYQEPWPACQESSSVELHAADDLHVYLGDGGDYIYVKQWVSGESVAGATDRFRLGTKAFEECVSAGELQPLKIPDVTIDSDGIDQLAVYDQPGLGPGEYRWVTFARNGGILMSLFIDIFLTEAYKYDEAERLVNAALDRLSAIGSVGVKTSESTSTSPFASTSTATPPTTARIQGTSTTASPAPADTAPPATTSSTDATPPTSPILLTDSLPPLQGYVYVPWTQDGIDAYRAGAFYPTGVEPFVEEFAGSDVQHNGQYIAWIELYHLRPEYRDGPDDAVLDFVSGYTYSPGPQTAERVTISGEQVLVRRTPNLAAWSWFDEGISFTVLANEIDPVEASNFVVALTAAQQAD